MYLILPHFAIRGGGGGGGGNVVFVHFCTFLPSESEYVQK